MSGLVEGILDELGPAGMAQIARSLAAILDADGDGSIIDDVLGGLTGQ